MDEILDVLVAHRVPGAIIARIARLLADAEAIERTRAAARERMRRVRERARTGANSSEHEVAPISKKEGRKEGSIDSRASRRKPKVSLPEDFHPELRGNQEFDRFCDHARANARLCADWEAAWRNWQRNAPRFNSGGRDVRGRRHGSVLDALDRLGEKLHAQGSFADLYVPGSSGPKPLRLDQDLRPPDLKLVPKK